MHNCNDSHRVAGFVDSVDLPWRALHARQHRAGVRFPQRQQVQRGSHRLAAAQAAQRASLPAPPPRDQRDARTAFSASTQ